MMDKLKALVKNKLFIITVVLLMALLLLIILSSASRSGPDAIPEVQPTSVPIPTAPFIEQGSPLRSTSEFTPEQLKAIEEQSTADADVAEREVAIRTNYPWFIKLPLRGEKYFVYFERKRQTFVGLLYPKSGDNVEAMKAEVLRRLREDIKIEGVEKYPFEWTVTPE